MRTISEDLLDSERTALPITNHRDPCSPLLIGYGNSLRGDDGAGPILAGRLARFLRRQALDVKEIVTLQLTPDLALDIADPSITHVLFVDATVAHDSAPDVLIRPIQATDCAPSLGHQMAPTLLLSYAKGLYGHAPDAYLITIGGTDFAFGQQLSEGVRNQLARADEVGHDLLCRYLCNSLQESPESAPNSTPT